MQQLMREKFLVFSMGKGTGAAANTREVISFLVWAHKKKENPKKKRKSKKKSKKKINQKRKKKFDRCCKTNQVGT